MLHETIAYEVVCDMCVKRLRHRDDIFPTTEKARGIAYYYGWDCIGCRDICPECKTKNKTLQ